MQQPVTNGSQTSGASGRSPSDSSIAEEFHVGSLHQEVDAVLTKVRALYSIIGDRCLLRSTTRSCVTCRRFQAKGDG